MTDRQPMIVIAVTKNDGETCSGYGVMREQTYEHWREGLVEPTIKTAYGLLYGGSELCDTYSSWGGVMQLVNDAEGEIVHIVMTAAT